jgi:NTE family protein
VGFRVDNEDKVQLSLDFVNENLFGSGTELGLLLFESSRERAVSLEQKAYRIFNTYLTYKVNAFYRSEDIYTYADVPSTSASTFTRDQTGEYNQTFYGGSFSVGTQVERFGNLIFEGKYQFDDVDNLQPQTVVPYNIKIVSIKASSTIDTQDRYPYPLKGFYFKGEYELAGKILGGSVGYTNFNFDYKGYFTFAGVQTLSPRVMMGFADNTLPLSEQYSLGGQSSFFGMRDNEFRGRQIFLTSLEYRYEIPFKIFFDTYFKLRYDLGSTWTEPEEIHFTDLRHGIGASLSFDTPIGPADFSTGKSFLFVKNLPKNPLSFGDTFFYFSIGYYY